MKTNRFSLAVLATLALGSVALAGPTKTYQVTGPILEMNDTVIVIEKTQGKNERWEIARDASTKASGEMKVGNKATITYTMTATEVDATPAKADKAAKAEGRTSPSPSPKK
ncbi:MAG: hypothetical protein M3P99_00605 [Pseudomonadota bacterium]|nr:hypothetical protein [Pseudomonadota bacterium]